MRNMHIVQIASELAPIAKVGGLADVIYGFSKELLKKGHTVEVLLPKYDCIDFSKLKNLKVECADLESFEGPGRYSNTIWSASLENLKVLLLEPHHPKHFFSRGTIYGCKDDVHRFLYFSRAALEYLFKAGKAPDILHTHDWPTGIIPVLLKEMYASLGFKPKGSVFTIHNLEYQGRCLPDQILSTGLAKETFFTQEKLQDPQNHTLANLLKGGIVYADQVTTVSPTYEKEIKTAEMGWGLHETLQRHAHKLQGILNGIDEDFWNPEQDPHLVKPYATHGISSAKKLEELLKGKAENRRHLRTHLGLQQEAKPLIACVTRLVSQKAPHLIEHALHRTLEKGGQFALLGSTLDPTIHAHFVGVKKAMAGEKNCAILLDQDEALAHLIFAAADMLIIPSIFEPCGLTQMISLRYGTIPVVRTTGGLADTIFDIDTAKIPLEKRNGFTFEHATPAGVNWALDRALECCKTHPEKWKTLIRQGIACDFSWKRTAPAYLRLYAKF